jgi:hypothetical protein
VIGSITDLRIFGDRGRALVVTGQRTALEVAWINAALAARDASAAAWLILHRHALVDSRQRATVGLSRVRTLAIPFAGPGTWHRLRWRASGRRSGRVADKATRPELRRQHRHGSRWPAAPVARA